MTKHSELPLKWCISRDLPQYKNSIVTNWVNTKFNLNYTDKQFSDTYYCVSTNDVTHHTLRGATNNGYVKITFDEFYSFLIKGRVILGYKAPYDLFDGKVKKDDLFVKINSNPDTLYYINNKTNLCVVKEVVLTWEPVYEETYKEINMGGFNLTVKPDGIFHKEENITKFVEGVTGRYVGLHKTTAKVEGYNFHIDDLIITKSGCENHTTKLSQWFNIWDEYQKLKSI